MSALQWLDIGANLTDGAFDNDLNEVIESALNAGVSRLIVTGTTVESSEQALTLTHSYPGTLYCTIGVHPHYSKSFTAEARSQLKSLLSEPGVVAVGETGLDFNRNFSTPQQQEYAFEQQLELASETRLPLFLHERDAQQRQTEILKTYRDQIAGGVAHCFTGDQEALYRYLDLDLYIGITGWICDERRGETLQRLVRNIPADRLLLETDAPYLIPRDLKPKPKSRRNLPEYLPHIASTVASLTGRPTELLSQQVMENCERLFNFSNQILAECDKGSQTA